MNGQQYMDEYDIYAVLYETSEHQKYQKGENVLTDKNIIVMGQIADPSETPGTEMKKITIPFDFDFSNRFDPEKLENYQYNPAVVFTSSPTVQSSSGEQTVHCSLKKPKSSVSNKIKSNPKKSVKPYSAAAYRCGTSQNTVLPSVQTAFWIDVEDWYRIKNGIIRLSKEE